MVPFRCGVAAVILIVGTAALRAQEVDVVRSLGIDSVEAHDSILSSFANGTLALVGERSIFTAASPEQRAVLVRGVVAAARAYTGRSDFASRYAAFREAARPERAVVPQNGEEARAAQMKQLEAVIQEALKMGEKMPPQAREDLEENIAFTKRQLAAINADPEHRKAVDAAAREGAKAAEDEYKAALAEFERKYPADPKRLVAQRLRAFLDMSATVDFSAKLVEKQDKRMRFVDPSLESMPPEWKMLYRAGKPAVDAARTAAQDWLKAIEG
jgi:hypothetical protein